MREAYLRPKMDVLARLKKSIQEHQPWVWVRQELKTEAEAILMSYQLEGKILSFEYDGERATRGSACYQIQHFS